MSPILTKSKRKKNPPLAIFGLKEISIFRLRVLSFPLYDELVLRVWLYKEGRRSQRVYNFTRTQIFSRGFESAKLLIEHSGKVNSY